MASIDRISTLSDDVLVHILSFLTTKKSVSTSILSKRWRFLWAHVPTLDFDINDYEVFDCYDFVPVTAKSFPTIINEVLSLHQGHYIRTVRLDLGEHSFPNSGLGRWIATAIARNVQKLDIRRSDFEFDGNMIPGCLFTCETLVDLSLQRCGYIPSTGDVSLPSLKKLNLEMVTYESDESLAHVISGSPVLEELIIQAGNDMGMMICCCISSQSLNRLVLESHYEFEDAAFRVKIDTPALRYLKLHDWETQDISAGRLTSLSEADIFFYNHGISDILYSRNVTEFVCKLYNVKCLTLSIGWMQVSDSVFSDLTIKFHNLTELELSADWRFTTYFIENADNLRSLTIDMDHMYEKNDETLNHWMEPKHIPASLVSHLETVSFKWFRCTEEAFNMVRYILRNAKVLKKVEIYFRGYGMDLEKKTEMCKIISLLERGSEACLLDFH